MFPEFPLLDLDLVWLAGQARQSIEPELFAVLDGIRRTGKLTLAAAEAGLPYRQAWGLLALWSERMGHALVTKEQGRGTRLTPIGERLLRARARIATRLSLHLENAASEIEQELSAMLAPTQPAIAIHAGRDLALAGLRDRLRRDGGPRLDVRVVGCVDALAALAGARCRVAGFHVPDGALGREVVRGYLPWLDATRQRLVHFVRRRQGLIVAPGNPLGIAGIEDIGRNGARFANRQPGSGTRLILDRLLEAHGVGRDEVTGYHSAEFTHLAVAAAVAGGVADVGLGVEAAARRFETAFIPLFDETYYLLIGATGTEPDDVAALLAALGGDAFRSLVAELPGYDAAASGTEVPLGSLLADG